ncbi:hypothetical protein [Marininema halotolerans]|uniref:Uncharacterized protein n=1 Tax=Marininema halotolerans TaxID=1155944 RepID=A0A1I6R5Z3_9BACL|nr:hypothetical protein [Marininema halotolerans]SFS59958.1 hypothetical protein SAMN05444972_104148 [Marininema halotolerans]
MISRNPTVATFLVLVVFIDCEREKLALQDWDESERQTKEGGFALSIECYPSLPVHTRTEGGWDG